MGSNRETAKDKDLFRDMSQTMMTGKGQGAVKKKQQGNSRVLHSTNTQEKNSCYMFHSANVGLNPQANQMGYEANARSGKSDGIERH